jgi:hypothetical protein
MRGLGQLAVTLAAFGIASCSPVSTTVAEPSELRVTHPAAKLNSKVNASHAMPDVKLTVVYWAWLGPRIAVTIHDMGGSYQFTGETLTPRKDLNRSWKIRVDKTEQLERLLSILNPHGLAEDDACDRSSRDGASWLVMNIADGTKTIRSRDANGTLALEECKSFDDACRQIMQIAGITCASEEHCLLAEDRTPASAGTP